MYFHDSVDVGTRITDDDFWRIDKLINSRPFRRTTTKFPLQYYNQIIVLSTRLGKRLLDLIYTDADVLLATWDAGVLLPKRSWGRAREMYSRETEEICAVILLCGLTPGRLVSSLEMRLVLKAIRNRITVELLLLPTRKDERIHEMVELISEYDRLLALLNRDEGARFRENVIETVQRVTGTAAENTATIGIETTATSLGHAAAGVVLAVFVDIAVVASMLARAKVRKDRGKITESQYRREIRERLFQTGCQFVAGTTGTIVGQIVVPVPVVGAAIGGFLGSLIGLGVSMGFSKIQRVAERVKRRKGILMLENG